MDSNLQQQLLVVAGVAEDKGRFLLLRRKEGLESGGLWEFPGGKVNPNEPLPSALRREIKEELNIDAFIGSPVGVGHFSRGVVVGFQMELDQKPVESKDHDQIEWVEASEILNRRLAPADYEIAVAALRQKVEIERVSTGSVVRLMIGLYFLVGLIVSTALYFGGVFLRGFIPPGSFPEESIPFGAVFFVPVLYAVIGALFGIFISGLYNFLTTWLGGIQFELRRR